MPLGLFKKKEETSPEEEYIEITPEAVREERRIMIRVEKVTGDVDVPRIQRYLREGYIIFLKIRDVRQRDISELKRIIERLKKTVLAINGDMVGVDEDFLVITPEYARIYRGAEEKERIKVV
mgnify:CR=1 FL=1